MSNKSEQVLVFTNKLFNELGTFQGVIKRPYTEKFTKAIYTPGNVSFVEREGAEVNPEYKQIIPYTVVESSHGRILVYKRSKKGGETRLHDKYSLGVGGHINDTDGSADSPFALYGNGWRREMNEELDIDGVGVNTVIGCIYDDTTPVGQVHFGVVHLLQMFAPTRIGDKCELEFEWKTRDEIKAMDVEWESWSKMVIENLL